MPDRSIVSPEDQGATFVELFFDLVFVFAVTQVTDNAAHHLDWLGVLRSMAVFWLIWWGWTQFTWALNSANTNHYGVRAVTLAASGIATVMAVSIDGAFSPHLQGSLPFAISYVAIRMLGLGLFLRTVFDNRTQRSAVILFLVQSLAGLLVVVVGAFFAPLVRLLFWLTAMLFDVGAGWFSGNKEPAAVNPGHFAERHGLVVIIALGESMFAAAGSLSFEKFPNVANGGIALVITCLLWWSYFGWVKDMLEETLAGLNPRDRTLLARDAYTFGHFPLVIGIIALAIGFEASSHPNGFTIVQTAAAMGIGLTLFLVSTAAVLWRAHGCVLWNRLIICALTIGGLVYSGIANTSTQVVLGVAAAGLVAIVIFEEVVSRRKIFAVNRIGDKG